MSWASRLAGQAETSVFRQAALTSFIFLLVAVVSVALSRHQIEALLLAHVKEMVLADVHNQERRQRLGSATELAAVLRRDEGREREGGMGLVLSAGGEALFGNRQLASALDCAPQCKAGWRHADVTRRDGGQMQMLGMQVPLADGGVFFSAYDILPMLERVRVIPLLAGASLLGVLLTCVVIGLYSSMRSMRRVDKIRNALSRYVGGEHAATVPAGSHGDEFDLLGRDINHVLARVNGLMDEVKGVSSLLAHELQTPLTRLHNRLASVAERVEDNLRDDIGSAVDEAVRIQRLFKAVLRIGEIEAGRCAYFFEWFDPRALLQDVAEYYEPLLEEARMSWQIDSAEGGAMYGDRALLFQALANLLENAVKYAAHGAHIVLLARVDGNWLELGVGDQGPGIPAALRGDAVKRFRRLDTRSRQGSGLGLALVNAIAKLHVGELVLTDNAPRGLLVVLRMNGSSWVGNSGITEALKR